MLTRWFERQWQNRSWPQLILWPLSCLFAVLVALRRALYRMGVLSSHALPVPVIVVGNLSVGGVGKTPVVLALVKSLRELGYQPGILTRGYGGQTIGLVTAQSDPLQLGDEPVLLARNSDCPVWVNPDRVAAGRALLAAFPSCDVLICDDGLQHYRLQRDVEIAVVQRPWGLGNGRLLPAGPLREPMRRLQQVQLMVESGDLPARPEPSWSEIPRYRLQLQRGAWTALHDPNRHTTIDALCQQSLVAIAGIGHPQRFFHSLQAMGLRFQQRIFNDHHAYTRADFIGTEGMTILMTEKDAVKCQHLDLSAAWYLPVQAELIPLQHSQSLQSKLQTLLAAKLSKKEVA